MNRCAAPYLYPGSPVDQRKPLVFRMIHGAQGFPILPIFKVWSTWTSWVSKCKYSYIYVYIYIYDMYLKKICVHFMYELSSCVHQPYHIFLMGFPIQLVNSASNWHPFSDQGYKYLKPPSTAILCIASLQTDAKRLKQTRHILRKCSTAGDPSQEILDLAKIKQSLYTRNLT